MVKAITFQDRIDKLVEILADWKKAFNSKLDYRHFPDYAMMQALGCTNQSYTRVRPMLIEYCNWNQFTKEEVREDGNITQTINISLKYDKKRKTWYGKRNELLIKAPDRTIPHMMTWRKMEPEEYENYKIVWSVSDYEEE